MSTTAILACLGCIRKRQRFLRAEGRRTIDVEENYEEAFEVPSKA